MFDTPISKTDFSFYRHSRRHAIRQSCQVNDLVTRHTQCFAGYTSRKLQWQYAHANQVRPVDSLKALNNHSLDTQKPGAFGRPVTA